MRLGGQDAAFLTEAKDLPFGEGGFQPFELGQVAVFDDPLDGEAGMSLGMESG